MSQLLCLSKDLAVIHLAQALLFFGLTFVTLQFTKFSMIEGFRHKGLKRFYENDDPRLLPPDMLERIRDLLTLLDAAERIKDLSRPSLRLHPLKGNLRGFWSITVRANWRIVFRFQNGAVLDVDFLDYH